MKKQQLPIVILHGWNLSGAHFSKTAKLLEKKEFEVYMPDLPGFGKNKTLSKPYSLSDYASFVKSFLKKKDIKECILLGHSFGGRVALFIASEKPQIVQKLILTGVPGFLPTTRGKVVFFLVLAKCGKAFFSVPPFSLFKKYARKFLYKAARAKDYYHAEGVLRQTFKKIVREDLEFYMKKTNCPTLLVWGENDKTTPVWIAKKMSETIKNSQLIVVENTNHMLPANQPREFVEKIAKFLA